MRHSAPRNCVLTVLKRRSIDVPTDRGSTAATAGCGFASVALARGASLSIIGKILGHADFKTTQRYAHLAPGRKAAAVESIVVPFHGAKPKAKKQGLHRIA